LFFRYNVPHCASKTSCISTKSLRQILSINLIPALNQIFLTLQHPDFLKNLVNASLDRVTSFGYLYYQVTNSITFLNVSRMAKEKLTLQDLKIESSITTLGDEQMTQLKGGYYIVRGRVFTYTSRWTTIDIRSDETTPGTGKAGFKH
jgi:hypothetical protein